LTSPFIYGLSFAIGKSLIGFTPAVGVGKFSLANMISVFKPLIVGNVILAIFAAYFAYVIVYICSYFFVYMKHKREDMKLQKEFEHMVEYAKESTKVPAKKEARSKNPKL